MRLITLIPLLILGLGCTNTKNATVKSGILNGTWVPVKQEINGTVLPPAALENQKLILSGHNYTFIAESTDKGVLTFKKDKMDIYGKEGVNAGKHFVAIYKYENEQLTVCYNLEGDTYPDAFDTKGKPSFFLCVFKKEAAAK